MKNSCLLLVLFFGSCQFFQKQQLSEKELLEKELKAINWKEVDEYPSFSDCDGLKGKSDCQKKFFDNLVQLIQTKLENDSIPVLYPSLDTIEVKVTIFPDSKIQFDLISPKDSVVYETIKIDSILHARLTGFPKVNPAIKRGIPVKTQFVLPVILKNSNYQ